MKKLAQIILVCFLTTTGCAGGIATSLGQAAALGSTDIFYGKCK